MGQKSQDSESPAVQPSFEGALDRLQLVVKKLESGELNLEQSLSFFEEGVKLTRLCQEQLSAAEQRVEILMKATPEQLDIQPFSGTKAR